jgi:HlyD family secretion protein
VSEPAPTETPPLDPQRRERPLQPAARKLSPPPARERSRALANVIRRGALLLVAFGALAAIVMAWLPKPIPVELTEVQRGKLLVTVDEDGRTRVKDRYIVSAPLMANLARIELTPGDAIEPGAVLARLVPLDPPLLDERTKAQAEARVAAASAGRKQGYASIERVRTAHAFALRETERQRSLIGSGAAATSVLERAELEERTLREELASAEFGARVADNDLRMAEAALGRLGSPQKRDADQFELIAPVKGRVLRVIQQSEGVVQPGTPLLELGDSAALEIVVDVLTSDAVHVRAGARVQIERWGGDQALRGHVRVVEPSAFTRISSLGVEEQRVNVVIDLDEPHAVWSSLGDGYRVEARIAVWEGTDVLSVPASAAFRRGESWAVFKVSGGVARVTKIDVGRRNAERVEVKSGLNAGDQVVAHPSERLSDGTSVEPR